MDGFLQKTRGRGGGGTWWVRRLREGPPLPENGLITDVVGGDGSAARLPRSAWAAVEARHRRCHQGTVVRSLRACVLMIRMGTASTSSGGNSIRGLVSFGGGTVEKTMISLSGFFECTSTRTRGRECFVRACLHWYESRLVWLGLGAEALVGCPWTRADCSGWRIRPVGDHGRWR